MDLLFTPRLSLYQQSVAPLPELDGDATVIQVMERYADIMYFAALNAWELDGHGTVEDFPRTRGDFHGWMSADPKGFAEGVKFAVCALTGKTAEQLTRDEAKARNSADKPATPADGAQVKKKSIFRSRTTRR